MQTPSFNAGEFSTDVRIERSRYGTPTATLWISAPRGTSFRRMRAALHAVAMVAELGTSAAEHWVIGIEVATDLKGYVYVETVNGTDAEARRAMALLGAALDAVFTTGA